MTYQSNSKGLALINCRTSLEILYDSSGPVSHAQILNIQPIFDVSNRYWTIKVFRPILDASFVASFEY
jgi:hypothetical protein